MEHLYDMPGLAPDFNRTMASPTVPGLLGLSGYARAGKDTVAGIITRLYGHQQVSFAAKLKELAYDLDPVISYVEHDFDTHSVIAPLSLATMVDKVGWEDAKTNAEVRRILQVLGTRVRHHLGSDIWVLAAMHGLRIGVTGSSRLGHVFSDVRFPNEADEIQRRGGKVLRVQRPGVSAINAHISETALDAWEFDGYIQNDGSLVDLEGEVQRVLGEFS